MIIDDDRPVLIWLVVIGLAVIELIGLAAWYSTWWCR